MSLINKMLQDLDARGSQTGAAMDANVKSVAQRDARIAPGLALAGLALIVALVLAGMFGWRSWKRPAAPPPLAVAAPAPVAAARIPAPQPVAAAPVAPPLAVPPVQLPAAPPAAAPVMPAPLMKVVKAAPTARAKVAKPHKEKRAAKHKSAVPPKKAVAKAAPRVSMAAAPQAGGREMSPAQRAESEYRRALAALPEGRVSDAIAALEQSLKLEPRHEAARQTLVGLLIEAKRQEEAIRLLQAGLTLDPRQPSMAMLLARLQIERGGPALETLMRTLPYAVGNGEYHAFLAGALQRAQRHREAIEQYQAALHVAPQESVWWMGMGLSLQAEKRAPEALDAFQRAKAGGKLNAELDNFVDRKIQQLNK
ncbi:MAG: tetratricopeptide repeat protein [Pseudomonadota bacterium]